MTPWSARPTIAAPGPSRSRGGKHPCRTRPELVASFDVLATLRRSGPPFRLSPGGSVGNDDWSPRTMTNRIDQLEESRGWSSADNPEDRRGVLIALTPQGPQARGPAVTDHVANQQRLVAGLEPDERGGSDARAQGNSSRSSNRVAGRSAHQSPHTLEMAASLRLRRPIHVVQSEHAEVQPLPQKAAMPPFSSRRTGFPM